MSSAETPAPSLLDALVTQRRQVAIGLAVAGAVLAAIAIWWGVWGFARGGERAAKSEGKVILEEEKKEEPAAEDTKPKHSADYQVASIWAAGLALVTLLAAGWIYTQPADPAAPRTAARTEVVAFGGTIGLLTALFGAVLGYRWYHSAVLWIGSKDATEAKWVLYAAAVFLVGLLIMFASLQLARTEERSNAMLRRVLYGFNSVFMGLLLLLVLAVINVVVFVKVPGTLAVNESAFAGLSDESKRFLHSLDRPVYVYLILPESHQVPVMGGVTYDTLYADSRGLLTACEDESPNFHSTFLSPAFDAERIATLIDRFKLPKPAEGTPLGMLITLGDDESASAFIRESQLTSIERGRLVFQAENRMLTEISYLTDPGKNQKIYFTQGHEELALDPGGPGGRSLSNIVQYLRDRKLAVEPLKLAEGAEPKIPEDAAVVVVAGPRRFFGPEDPMRRALTDYSHRPGKPGKLFMFLPAFPDANQHVSATGLEPLLAEMGVTLESDRRLATFPGEVPVQARLPLDLLLIQPAPLQDLDLARIVRRNRLLVQNVRAVTPAQSAMGPAHATPLFVTAVVTWQESDYGRPLDAWMADFRNDRTGALLREKRFTDETVPVAVAVTDNSGAGDKQVRKSRAIVFGTDSLIDDRPAIPAGPEQYRQLIMSDGIDWLREREGSFGISPQKVSEFALEKPIDWTSQVVLMGLVTVGITVLGVGVWLSRRR